MNKDEKEGKSLEERCQAVAPHRHRCSAPDCGIIWEHVGKAGDEAAHKCPKCGTLQWKRFEEGRRMQELEDELHNELCVFFAQHDVHPKAAVKMLADIATQLMTADADSLLEDIKKAVKAKKPLSRDHEEPREGELEVVGAAEVNALTGEVRVLKGPAPPQEVVDKIRRQFREEHGLTDLPPIHPGTKLGEA